MAEACEVIQSIRGGKISVNGFIYVKDKIDSDSYYWCCGRRKTEDCRGRAVTKILDGQHIVHKIVEHNHAPDTSAALVSKIVEQIKELAKASKNLPCQII